MQGGCFTPLSDPIAEVHRVATFTKSIPERIANLDELRGAAVISVMLAHGYGFIQGMLPIDLSPLGHHGVVLFFYISGFIITKILRSERDRSGPADYFRKFYIRRLFRIWPLMLLALSASALLYPETASLFVYNLLLVNNYHFAATDEVMGRTDVMWSLAVEEQFYLLWPLLVLVTRGRWLPVVCVAISVTGFAFACDLLPVGPFIHHRYFVTHFNMQYIAMGAVVALSDRLPTAVFAGVAGVALTAAGLDLAGGSKFITTDFGLSRMAIDLAIFGLFYFCARQKVRLGNALVLLRHAGLRCYGLYLIHFFISVQVMGWLGCTLAGFAAYFAVTLVLAELSFWLFERPIERQRVWFEGRPTWANALFGCIAIVVLASLIQVLRRSQILHW